MPCCNVRTTDTPPLKLKPCLLLTSKPYLSPPGIRLHRTVPLSYRRLTDSKLHVVPEELEELAWLAARDAAAEAVSALNRRGSLTAGRKERHRFVCNMLRNGTIRDANRMENGRLGRDAAGQSRP
jgi:hypothetical protein